MGSMVTGKDLPYHLPEELRIPSQQVNGIIFPAVYDMVEQISLWGTQRPSDKREEDIQRIPSKRL